MGSFVCLRPPLAVCAAACAAQSLVAVLFALTPRAYVSRGALLAQVTDAALRELVGEARFHSVTYRLFKLPGRLETACEDYGQVGPRVEQGSAGLARSGVFRDTSSSTVVPSQLVACAKLDYVDCFTVETLVAINFVEIIHEHPMRLGYPVPGHPVFTRVNTVFCSSTLLCIDQSVSAFLPAPLP